MEQQFQEKTVGLVTIDEFRKARESVEENIKQKELKLKQEAQVQIEFDKKKKADRIIKRKKVEAALSFNMDDDNDNDVTTTVFKKSKKLTKNPHVNTNYLPDKEREEEIKLEKERLKIEWLNEQERIKKQVLEIVFSYWDGSGHRKTIKLPKGTTIGTFLHKVKSNLSDEFKELRNIGSDQLMYIKEDLIIPQHFSFYDLIITKARGKSGPLFHFDVHDDIRLKHDIRIEKDESHPGKVVERHWYEKNKHIFPGKWKYI